MRHRCLSCQNLGSDHQYGYHAECAIKLFGTETPPTVRFSTPEILNEVQKMVGKNLYPVFSPNCLWLMTEKLVS